MQYLCFFYVVSNRIFDRTKSFVSPFDIFFSKGETKLSKGEITGLILSSRFLASAFLSEGIEHGDFFFVGIEIFVNRNK